MYTGAFFDRKSAHPSTHTHTHTHMSTHTHTLTHTHTHTHTHTVRLEETFDMSTTVKFVYVHWVGKDIPYAKRGKYGVVHGSIEQYFSVSTLSVPVRTKRVGVYALCPSITGLSWSTYRGPGSHVLVLLDCPGVPTERGPGLSWSIYRGPGSHVLV